MGLLSVQRNAVSTVSTGAEQCDSHGSHGFTLHNSSCSLLFGYLFRNESSNLSKALLDICLHVDILFCHVSPPQRKEMFNLNAARVLWTTVACDVVLGRCFISFRHCGTLWRKHLHFRRQSGAQENFSLIHFLPFYGYVPHPCSLRISATIFVGLGS